MFFVIGRSQHAPAQENEFLTQLILQLSAVKVQRNIKAAEEVVAVEKAMALLHIQKLNGENIRGTLKFFARENQRRVMLLLRPPFDCGRDCGKRRKRAFPQNAKQVDIGEFGMKFSVRSGTVEDHALEICSRCHTQPADKFTD